MTHSSNRPTPPYYAVIFTSVRTEGEDQGYGKMAEQMVELAKQQPGFLGVESVRDANGFGITVSYWESNHGKVMQRIRLHKSEARPSGMRTTLFAWPKWSGSMGWSRTDRKSVV